MKIKSRYIAIVGAAVLAGAAIAGGIVAAGDGDDEELTGETRDKAVAAAQAAFPGSMVLETEIGDDSAAYEVELRLTDGRTIEVQLDKNFVVTGSEEDDDVPGEKDD